MKIVDYETFIRMPAGTIFAPFTPCTLKDDLEIKVDGGREYEYRGEKLWGFNGTMPLIPWNLNDLFDVGDQSEAEFEVYDGDQNDASAHNLFCVLEPVDIEKFIKALRWAMAGCHCEFEDYVKENYELDYKTMFEQLMARVDNIVAKENEFFELMTSLSKLSKYGTLLSPDRFTKMNMTDKIRYLKHGIKQLTVCKALCEKYGWDEDEATDECEEG